MTEARFPAEPAIDNSGQGEAGAIAQDGARTRRRSLVLTDESARHPFRSILPPRVREEIFDIPAESLWALTRDDVRGVASTYVTVTAAVLAFIL